VPKNRPNHAQDVKLRKYQSSTKTLKKEVVRMDNNENVELEQAQATPEQPQNDNVDNQQAEAPKSFTQEEVDKIVTDRVNRALKKAEKEAKAKADEAEKLRSMNAEQKAKYEAEKKDAEIARLTAQLNRQGMEKEASQLMTQS
jgi:hypothetical protein